MELSSLLSTYGYLALFIGTFLEGETILILAGLFAQRGYLDLDWVIIVAFIGTYAGDQMFYYLGRSKGLQALERRPHWKEKVEKVFVWLRRYRVMLVLGFRFLYGIRAVTPFAIGASGINPFFFLILNGIGAFAWAVIVAWLGYLFGTSIEAMLTDIKNVEVWVLSGVLLITLVVWRFRFRR